jgi:hypothetical protein
MIWLRVIKSKLINTLIGLGILYLLILLIQGLRWRLDPHHDGIMFLPALMAKNNQLPQESLFYFYGIAQPFIEGLLLKVLPSTLIVYRLIALTLILLTGYFIYKIIALKQSKTIALVFSLTWLYANPTWANSLSSTPISIQSSWPNLWIQMLFISCIYIILKTQLKSFNSILLLSLVANTLPFFRAQGIIYTVLIGLFALKINRNKAFQYLANSFITTLMWLFFIHSNGGLPLYIKNTVVFPREFYSVFTEPSYIYEFLTHSIIYYSVSGLTLIFCLSVLNFAKPYNHKLRNLLTITVLILTLVLITKAEFKQWIEIMMRNSSSFITDSFMLIAIFLTIATAVSGRKISFTYDSKKHTNLGIFAVMSLSNLIFQFPLPDLGHRWWSSAILILLISEIYFLNIERTTAFWKLISKKAIMTLCIASITISATQGIKFLSFERNDLVIDSTSIYKGIEFPIEDKEMVKKFNDSLGILAYLEGRGLKVNYFCRDGLYYLKQQGVVSNAKNFLYSPGKEREEMEYVNDVSSVITFYCDTNLKQITNISEFNYVEIGNAQTNLFIVSDPYIFQNLKNYIKVNNIS